MRTMNPRPLDDGGFWIVFGGAKNRKESINGSKAIVKMKLKNYEIWVCDHIYLV